MSIFLILMNEPLRGLMAQLMLALVLGLFHLLLLRG